MKARNVILAAATSLVIAAPAFAGGSYGEGSLWTELIAQQAEFAQRTTASAPSAAAGQAPTVFAGDFLDGPEVSIYEKIVASRNASRS